MTQPARKTLHEKLAATLSGVNEELHQVSVDVNDPAQWTRPDLDLVMQTARVDWNSKTGTSESRTGYHLRLMDSGPNTALCLCGPSGRVLHEFAKRDVAAFLQMAYVRLMTPPAPRKLKVVSILDGKREAC